MIRRSILLLATLGALSACQGETDFTQATGDNNEVEGNGKLEISPETLDFADLEVGLANSEIFKIKSVGDNNLKLYKVEIADSGGGIFYMEEVDDIELAPGTEREFTVVATLPEEGSFEGSVRVKSNDVDNLDIRIEMSAWSVGSGGDGGSSDGGSSDGGGGDGGSTDGGSTDGGSSDGGSSDGGSSDGGSSDGGSSDGGSSDGGSSDGGSSDGGSSDGGSSR